MVTLVQFLVIFLTGTCQSMLNKSSLCFSCQMTWKERFQTNISVGATRVSSSAWRRHLQRDNLLQSTALDRGMVGGAEKEWKLRWLAREEDCSLLYEERRREEGDGVMEQWSDAAGRDDERKALVEPQQFTGLSFHLMKYLGSFKSASKLLSHQSFC